MSETADLRELKLSYAHRRQADESSGQRSSLSDDALIVVLEFGPERRLSQEWRLEARRPLDGSAERESSLAVAHAVTQLAYERIAEAWPHDRRSSVPDEVSYRVDGETLEALTLQYPHLNRELLRQAVDQANYVHAK
jgi:uncharacterized protein (DUF433 family)